MGQVKPKGYRYYEELLDHLGNDESIFFNGQFVYPRQFEIHLPANHIRHCECNCLHCQGKYFDQSLGTWELDAIELLTKLQGAIPRHIYGGAYSEPLMNPYLMTFLGLTKRYDNHFGIHTNGILLNQLEENYGWLTELNRISTDKVDYISVSMDAGLPWTWHKEKKAKTHKLFYEVVDGLKKACDIRDKNKTSSHAIRMCYLITEETDSPEDIASVVAIAKSLKLDSLRFSIPYAPYNQDFSDVKKYENERKDLLHEEKYYEMIQPYLSKYLDEKPYIFFVKPETTDVEQYNFNTCGYGYFQITYGADGYIYKCSASATPTAKQCRIGKITADLEEFKQIIMKNYDKDFDCNKNCFEKGVRCNRMAIEINQEISKLIK